MVDIQSVAAEIRRGKKRKRKKKKETTGRKYNGLFYSIGGCNKVVFSAEDLVLIKVICQEKGYYS